MNSSSKPSHGRIARRFLAAMCTLGATSAFITGCSSKPDASAVEPFVMEDLGACSLWNVSDVRKTDSVVQGNSYKIDFTAILTLKDKPERVWADAKQRQGQSAAFSPACLNYFLVIVRQRGGSYTLPEQQATGASLSEQYKVAGYAVLIKSEKGWQLVDEIRGISFEPIVEKVPPATIISPAAPIVPQESAQESAQAEISETPKPCLDERMRAWDKKRADEIEQLAAQANARDEEVQISAGMEDVLRSEALTQYTAECQQRRSQRAIASTR